MTLNQNLQVTKSRILFTVTMILLTMKVILVIMKVIRTVMNKYCHQAIMDTCYGIGTSFKLRYLLPVYVAFVFERLN